MDEMENAQKCQCLFYLRPHTLRDLQTHTHTEFTLLSEHREHVMNTNDQKSESIKWIALTFCGFFVVVVAVDIVLLYMKNVAASLWFQNRANAIVMDCWKVEESRAA